MWREGTCGKNLWLRKIQVSSLHVATAVANGWQSHYYPLVARDQLVLAVSIGLVDLMKAIKLPISVRQSEPDF